MIELNNLDEVTNERDEVKAINPIYKIEKIPAKVEERILLFVIIKPWRTEGSFEIGKYYFYEECYKRFQRNQGFEKGLDQ